MTVAMKTQFDKVSDLLVFVNKEAEDDMLLTEYRCNVEVQLAGDSIWDCDIERVTITGIHISESFEDDGEYICTHIGVTYNVAGDTEYEGSWRLYTDNGFSDAVSALLMTDVDFTEQGMQEDNYASMEL
jgi:hypothetical protein